MNSELQKYLSHLISKTIIKCTSVSGGDISQAYQIETKNETYFLKINASSNALKMFQTEALGLQSIAETGTIKTPQVIAYDCFENFAFLLMEFVESKSASANDFKRLGTQLAQLHLCTATNFGLNHDNFIGNLPQSNSEHNTWIDFYTFERLIPQLNLAKEKGLLLAAECPSSKHIKSKLEPLFHNIKPSLLHGDLWSGNYVISEDGTPCLIDPATYYGHHEIDIAMSKLFGGFGTAFYKAYNDILPEDNYSSIRMEIYQLYYLLVHLNLFGTSYYNSVISKLRKHF